MNGGYAKSHHAHGSLHCPAVMLGKAYRALVESDVTGSTVWPPRKYSRSDGSDGGTEARQLQAL
jgi:hypothetical protein